MFRRLPETNATEVAIVIDGEPYAARAGDTVAAALLASGRIALRTTAVGGVPRGPFCLMGVCFDCLVAIDGRPAQQACAIAVSPGMRVDTHRPQAGA
jgi:predicted molibdopterin-dependent oxidoreductase YjgC